MKKTNKKYIVICVAVILIIAIVVIYEITGNKNNSLQTDKSEYSVSATDNEKNNADNFISDNKETQIRDDYAEIYDYEYQGNYARVKFKDGYWGIVNKNGKVIFEKAAEIPEWDAEIKKRVFHSFHCRPIQSSDLALTKKVNQIRVIDLVSHELITKERIENWTELPGMAAGVNPEKDVVKLVALERHEGNGHIGIGFLGNYGLKKGAVATSVGHDSHNLVIAGVTDEDIAAAGNRVVENEGGLAIAVDGKVVLDLPLKIAGLMSELPVEEVDRRLEAMKSLSQELGVHEDVDAFMTLAFVSLPVIPKLRLNTYGVIDAEKQQIVDVFYSI